MRPMLATAGPLPDGEEWVYEVKWDGVRVLADVTEGRVRLTSRNGNDVTAAYPELAGLADVVADGLLDGEIVTLVDGRPSFEALQERMHVRDPRRAAQLARSCPVTLVVFDVLRLYGVDLTRMTYDERRGTLERMALDGSAWHVPAVFTDGPSLLEAARRQGLEGVVAKRRGSRYRPGSRSPDWVKVPLLETQECVVGGWRPGQGAREGAIGSLLVGVREGRRLHYAGRVGSGLGAGALADLARLLGPLAATATPFDPPPPAADSAGATWCRPEVVVEVRHAGWTRGGRLRKPTFRGLRPDKDPEEVIRA